MKKSECMTNPYSITRLAWKWTKKLYFHLLDIATLKQFHHFHLLWFRTGIKTIQTGTAERPNTRSMMNAMTSDHMTWKSWPKDLTQDTTTVVLGREQNSVPCGVHLKKKLEGEGVTEKRKRNKQRKTKLKNPECNVGLLCPSLCFRVYHTKMHCWRLILYWKIGGETDVSKFYHWS